MIRAPCLEPGVRSAASGFGVPAARERFRFRRHGGQLGGLLGPPLWLIPEVADDDHDGADEVNGGEEGEVNEVDQELQEKTGSQHPWRKRRRDELCLAGRKRLWTLNRFCCDPPEAPPLLKACSLQLRHFVCL